MLAGTIFFFILTLITVFLIYTLSNPTLVLIAKIVLYIFLIGFVICFISFMLSQLPPIPADESSRLI